jgi:hypothetical protein
VAVDSVLKVFLALSVSQGVMTGQEIATLAVVTGAVSIVLFSLPIAFVGALIWIQEKRGRLPKRPYDSPSTHNKGVRVLPSSKLATAIREPGRSLPQISTQTQVPLVRKTGQNALRRAPLP